MPILKRLPVSDATDLASLRASGLTDQTIIANDLRSDELGTVFPYRDLRGAVNCFKRWRLRQPVGPKKYHQPFGSEVKAYFPVASLMKLRDGQSPIYITEGEKKALALSQLGHAAIGLGGVTNWNKPKTTELLDELAEIVWTGRIVYIVFDYDVKPKAKRNVDIQRRKLAKALRALGATVYSVVLPPGPDGGKQGCDDFLVAHGAEALLKLVEQAEPVPETNIEPLTRASGQTDQMNGRRLVAKFGEDIHYVAAWKQWIIWDGRRWKPGLLEIEARAKETADTLFKEIGKHVADKEDKSVIARMIDFAKRSNNKSGVASMIVMARSEPGIEVSVGELDTDVWLLNVQNGTIDLRTGALREHRKEDLLTKISPVTFDARAECPTWERFVASIYNDDADLIRYMQRNIGYALTGSQQEQICLILWGGGSNGKSTKVRTLQAMLGADYAIKATAELLKQKNSETHPTDRADLFGIRLAACMETEHGDRLAEAFIKELTGGDAIRTRRLYENNFEFPPTHHLWICTNHKPVIIGRDHGIWRRIKLIPFQVVIPDDKQDKRLPEKLAAELPGILNWAIAGCMDWQRDGMREPECVKAATKEYANESDDVGKFIAEHCETGPGFLAPSTALWQAYQAATGDQISQRMFAARLTARQFVRKQISGGAHKGSNGWVGIRLLSDAVVAAIQPNRATKEGA